jgi:hypothetical protein
VSDLEPVLRRTSVALFTRAMLGGVLVSGTLLGIALPAAAASGGTVHPFSIPGVYGIRAWGSYARMGAKVRVTVCVTDTARGVYGGAAAAVAFDSSHHQSIAAIVIGYRNSSCRTMLTSYTSNLSADALSGWRDGKVRQAGRSIQIY